MKKVTTVRVNLKRIYKETGATKLVAARETIEAVTMRYRGGRVQTQSGDVWSVIPDPESKADYVVVG